MKKNILIILFCCLAATPPVVAQTPSPSPTPTRTGTCLPCLAVMGISGVTIQDGVSGCSDYDNRPDAGEIIRCKINGSSTNACCTGPATVKLYLTTTNEHVIYLGQSGSNYNTLFYFYIAPEATCLESLEFIASGYITDSFPDPGRDHAVKTSIFELESDLSATGEPVCDTSNCELTSTYGSLHLEAESCQYNQGTVMENAYVSSWDSGDSIGFAAVDFNDPADTINFFQRIRLSISSNITGTAGVMEVHLDNPAGELLAAIPIPGTGSLYTYKQVEASLAYPANFNAITPRIHNLYLVLNNSTGSIFLDWLELLPLETAPRNPQLSTPTPFQTPTPTPSPVPIVNLTQLAEFKISDYRGYFCLDNDYLYMSYNVQPSTTNGIEIYNIGNPAAPVKVGMLAINEGTINDLAIKGNYLFLTDSNTGLLRIIDIQDRNNPVAAAEMDLGNRPNTIKIAGDYAFITNSDSGVMVINIADPLHPQFAASYTGPYVHTLELAGNYLYLPIREQGVLEIVDITDPLNPLLTGTIADVSGAQSVTVNGDTAYLLCQDDPDDSIVTINVASKTNPYAVTRLTRYYFGATVKYIGGLLYADYAILDLFRSPTSIQVAEYPSIASDIAVHDNNLYLYFTSGYFRIYAIHDTRQDYVRGDVNLDGNVDILDALMVAQYYVGALNLDIITFHTGAADFNQSGNIDIIDALMIAQYYVGLIT